MDAMTPEGRIMQAGIEFQPDLQSPRKPVRLGVLVLTASGDGVLLGRQPVLERRPPEFADVGPMSLELAADWVDSMWKDILEADKEHVFLRLNERWRWNLYVRPLRVRTDSEQADLLTLAKQVYQKFVGEPFHIPSRRRRLRALHVPRRRPAERLIVPPSWLVSEIVKRSSMLGLAATA
jgi:hypothetical protein